MSKVVLGMIISLDGFVNDRSGSVSRLYPDLEALGKTDVLQEAIRTTGAVVMGRHAYEMAKGDFSGYEFQVPIFVVTHEPPETVAKGENENLKFSFVSDGIESAVRQAKAAAGDKNVTMVGGAEIARQSLQAGLVDELELDVMPVLLGGGLRLFEQFDAPIELETTTVLQYAGLIHQVFRVVK
ncbi:MAG: dihydrofolate reductase family protein [Chloroflexota bacterium]